MNVLNTLRSHFNSSTLCIKYAGSYFNYKKLLRLSSVRCVNFVQKYSKIGGRSLFWNTSTFVELLS